MPITVDSSQWTGQPDDQPLAVPVVWGEFESEAARDAARARLQEAGAREQGLETAPSTMPGPGAADNAAQVDVPDENPKQADARNQRQLHVGTASAATSMAAAGIVIATGGAALPAVAAAAAAGLGTAAVGTAVGTSLSPGPDGPRTGGEAPMEPVGMDGPVIGLQAPDAATRERAERLLREAGAQRIHVQETTTG